MPRVKKQHLKKRSDGRYACRYKDQWFYGATEEEALQLREDYKRLEKQKLGKPVTVREYAEGWLERTKLGARPSTITHRKRYIKKLLTHIGDSYIQDVTPSQIKEVYTEEYKNVSNYYIKHARYAYASLFSAAVDDGLCAENPVKSKSARPHRGTYGTHRAISQQERDWIHTYATDHPVYPAVMAMLYAGLRPQEAKALDIDRDMDFDSGMLSISHFVHLEADETYTIDEQGKTSKSTRSVPIFPPLADAVQGKHGLLVPRKNETLSKPEWQAMWSSYVHRVEKGINGRTKSSHTRMSKKLNLDPWIPFTVTPYDLRHSFVTWCRDYGAELHTVIRWMGHTDFQMVLKIYDEVTDDRSQQEAEKLLKTAFRSQNGSQAK